VERTLIVLLLHSNGNFRTTGKVNQGDQNAQLLRSLVPTICQPCLVSYIHKLLRLEYILLKVATENITFLKFYS